MPIRIYTRIPMFHTRIIRISTDQVLSKSNLIRVPVLPYAYHQNNFPLSKLPYAYERPHTLLIRKTPVLGIWDRAPAYHTRIAPRECPSYAYDLIPYAYGTVSYAKHQKN